MILSIHDPVYQQNVLVVIGEKNVSRIIRAIKKSGYPVPYPDELVNLLDLTNANARTVGDRASGLVVIRLEKLSPRSSADIAVLAHECVHAATMLFDRIGFPVKAETDEPVAYYVSFLVRAILEGVK